MKLKKFITSMVLVSFVLIMFQLQTSSAQMTIKTIAGTGSTSTTADGHLATSTNINDAGGAWSDTAGNIYFTDFNSPRVRVVAVGSSIVSTIAGTGTSGSATYGVQATASTIGTHMHNLPTYVYRYIE